MAQDFTEQDTTKCTNDVCPLKTKCYRHNCDVWHWQQYDCFKPDDDGKCDYFVPDYKKICP